MTIPKSSPTITSSIQTPIVFRTAAGTKLLNALKGPCALEVDGYGAPSGMAWSVVVKGQAGVMEDPTEKLRADALKLDPWQPGSKHHYLRIRPTSVTVRQFKTTLPDVWDTQPWDARTELSLNLLSGSARHYWQVM